MSNSSLTVQGRAPALAAYPHARRVGDFLFVSGISSRRANGTYAGVEPILDVNGQQVGSHRDIGEQTRAVLTNIDAIIRAAGGSLADVVDVTVFLVDMADYAGMNAVYNAHFDAATGPARTTVAVKSLPGKDLLVEIKSVAWLGEKGTELA